MSNEPKQTILQVDYQDLINMAEANNITPYKSGANSIQCSFCLPNMRTWLIVWAEIPAPVNVTIIDGEVGAIVHDKV